ncbi:MAG: DUF488 family protein [Cuniculiplasma divulgatum]|nr:MAG: DUF488 family protein [Cuniculiplasma divulgatum]
MKPNIALKRVYESVGDDGFRVLVERLWPRGISREKAHVDYWAREIAPSTELRRWYSHDPDKWVEFRGRYMEELRSNHKLAEFKDAVLSHPMVTFLFASRETEKNSASVLREFILQDI